MTHLLSFKKQRSWKVLITSFFLFNSSLFAQNLVLNPSFEDVNLGSLNCSWYTSVAQFNNAINNWTLPTGGSTDIFNTALATTCYCSPFSTNASSPGTQAPRTGNGYVNIVTYGNGGCTPWREYIQGQLTTPLVVGTTYEVEMWVTLADKMSVGTNNIGVKFDTNPYTQGSNCPYYTTPDLNYTGPIIIDKQNWVQIIFCYTPTTAGLDNFIIGNFYNDGATATQAAGGVTSGNTIRYFVDDVRIEAITTGNGDAGTPGAISLCAGDPAVDLFNSLGGTPDMTGTWSGPSALGGGYLGTFDPAVNPAGTYTYSVAGGSGPCAVGGGSASADVVVTLINNFDATISPVGPFCATDPALQLNAVDGGGTWSGTGITDPALGTFDPATAGVGTHTITYSITGTCGDVQTTTITINANFDATITAAGPFCVVDPSLLLNAVDGGGTWSGTGITDPALGTFDPSTAGVGTHTITYSISGACGDLQTTTITINQNFDATIAPVGPYCVTDPSLQLNAVDGGGAWSGNGITDPALGTFDPSTAGVGIHTITYSIPGACGDLQTTTITINPNFDATIIAVGPFCETDPALQLNAVDGGGTWSGNGITDPALGTFDPATAGVGTHTITYSISGTCGDLQTTTITITQNFDATITAVGPFCETDPALQLNAVDGGGTWSGNGITDPALGSFDPATAGAGTHTITYTIAGNCGDVQTTSIVINPIANATITAVGPFCETDPSLQLNAVDGGGTWTGTGITDPTLGTFDPLTAGSGTHIITYTIGGNCGDVQTASIVVNPLDDPTITPAGPFCLGSPVVTLTAATATGTWSGVGITDPVSGSFDATIAGTGIHQITFVSGGLCPNTGTVLIEVLEPLNVIALQDETLCAGESATLSASATGGDANYTYVWQDQSGATVGTGTTITVSPAVTTIYTVTVTDGCQTPAANDAVTVTIIPIPTVSFTADNVIGCSPLDVTFTNNSVPNGTNCLWDFGDGLNSTSCGTVTHQFTDVGCYTITLTVSEGVCINSLTQTNMVCIVEDPVANFTFTPDVAEELDPTFDFTNTSNFATSYIWDFGDNSTSTVEHPSHLYAYTPEDYLICLTAYNDYGCSNEICKPVLVEEGLIFYMPNTFTPDGDAFNQNFKPVFTSGFDPYDFKLLIFNRWGEVVWESNDASVGWDGTYNGKLVQNGTYVWKVEFKTLSNDERIMRTGHVNVIR